MVPNRDRYQSTFFEKGESLSLGAKQGTFIMKRLQSGDQAPDFSAQDQDGNTVNLADFKGRRLFIFFYPKANTSG